MSSCLPTPPVLDWHGSQPYSLYSPCHVRSRAAMSTPSPSNAAIPLIFVSHSHQDDDYCRAFVHELRAAGADVWYDEHNLTSGQLLTDIQRELHARRVFVPILSKAALHESTWVK